MENIFKKFGFVFAAAALITAGASNLYANEIQWPVKPDRTEYQRHLDINTGSSDF
jgi:hypothetical protein